MFSDDTPTTSEREMSERQTPEQKTSEVTNLGSDMHRKRHTSETTNLGSDKRPKLQKNIRSDKL